MMKNLKKHARKLIFLGLSSVSMAASAACYEYNPLAKQEIISLFGPRYHPVHHAVKPHGGIDFVGAAGTPIFAANSGTVTTFPYNGTGGAGNHMKISGSFGTTGYMHMTRFLVNNNDKVTAGQVIGTVGNTGFGTGPHLHFEYFDKSGKRMDPKSFLSNATLNIARINKDRWDASTSNPGNLAFPIISAVGASECSGAPTGASVSGGATSTPSSSGAPVPDAPIDNSAPDSGLGAPNAPIQNYPSTNNISLHDFFDREAGSRFPNPQWQAELDNPGDTQREQAKLGVTPAADALAALPTPAIHMLRELNILISVKNMMTAERFLQKEQIQAKHAALMSLNTAEYSEKIIGMSKIQNSR